MTFDLKSMMELTLEYGVNVENRVVFLQGSIDEETVGIVQRGLLLLQSIDKNKPITLIVSSCGGDLEESLGLHDVIRKLNCPINTIALGKCQSAAPLLVACGTGKRYAAPNCFFMLHGVQLTELPDDSPKNVKVTVDEAEFGMNTYAKLLAKYSGKRKQFYARIFDKGSDRNFTAEEALEWGLVDELWS